MKYLELLDNHRLDLPAAAEGFYQLNGDNEAFAHQLCLAEFHGFGADVIIRRGTNLAVAKQVRSIIPFRNMATAHGVNTSWTNGLPYAKVFDDVINVTPIMKLTLRKTKQEASDIFSFIFMPERSLRWRPGQYLHYILNHPKPDDRGMERYFSIASAPHENQVMLTTRFAPKGSSFKKALKKLMPGDEIEVHEKGGDFVLDHRRKTFVFIAGGIGITPFRAILLDMERNRNPLNVQLLYANRDNDFPYRKELDALKKRHTKFGIDYVVSPNRIDEKTIPKFVHDMDKPVFYVSGPEPMVESLDKTLKKLGVSKQRIKNDFFPGYHWP